MKLLLCFLPLLFVFPVVADDEVVLPSDRVIGRVENTDAGERILIQEVWIDAPVAEVWKAHTTEDGWAAWSSPLVKIDLRIGGTIQTHYDGNAAIGDEGTNTLHILNYVPERILTLRADVSKNWPELMKQDADKMSNVILFEDLGDGKTHLTSYGVGYRDTPEYDALMRFFIQANEGLYEKLIATLEKK